MHGEHLALRVGITLFLQRLIVNQHQNEWWTCNEVFHRKNTSCRRKRKHSLRSIQHRFKRVKDRGYIRRFRILNTNNTAKAQRRHLIDSFVYEAFTEAR